MGKTNGGTNNAPEPVAEGAEEKELLALEVWADEVNLPPVQRQVLRVLYQGQKRTREDWQKALEEALNRPVR